MWRSPTLLPQRFFKSCILLIFGTLIYSYYQSTSNFYNLLVEENITLEQPFEQATIYCLSDRSRQHSLLSTLQVWTQFTQLHHIRYWIAYETLAGYIYHRALLPYDSNIDLFIMANDTSVLLQLSQSKILSDYELQIYPQWYVTVQTKRSNFSSEGIDFHAPSARFKSSKDNHYLNIWPVYTDHPNETRTEKKSQAILTVYDKNHQWKSFPQNWTFPLRECQLSGIKVWCPAEPEKLVADIYEQISLKMSTLACVNGTWTTTTASKSAKTTTEINDQSTSMMHDTDTSTTSLVLDDSDLIEKALDSIQICNARDRPRQRILLTTLQTWAHLAEKLNISYWLSYGTLLGYVRHRGLIPHDADVDIAIMSDDTAQLINVSQTQFPSAYKIKIQPHWKTVGYQNRSYFRDQGINFIVPNARFVDRKTNYHIDIFPAHNYNPQYPTNATKQQSENISEYDGNYNWQSYPRSWIYPLEVCYFSGIKVLCPAKSEKIAETVYGRSSLTKSNTKCVNGSWVSAG